MCACVYLTCIINYIIMMWLIKWKKKTHDGIRPIVAQPVFHAADLCGYTHAHTCVSIRRCYNDLAHGEEMACYG